MKYHFHRELDIFIQFRPFLLDEKMAVASYFPTHPMVFEGFIQQIIVGFIQG
jgi:hypothetical protein